MARELTYYLYENDSCLLSGNECNSQSCINCKIAFDYENREVN